jgi:DNA-binding HxlR family transcriptional regulator
MRGEESKLKTKANKTVFYRKTKELGRLIGKEKTLDILEMLDDRPRQYKEIEATLEIGHATLLDRLNKLQELGLIKKKPITSKRRETHVYDFTLGGIEFMKFIKSFEKTMSISDYQQKIVEIK